MNKRINTNKIYKKVRRYEIIQQEDNNKNLIINFANQKLRKIYFKWKILYRKLITFN